MSIQDGNPLVYRGFTGYNTYETCMKDSVRAENFMIDVEKRRGNGNKAIWVKSFCIPYDIFPPKNVSSKNGTGV